MQKRLLDLSYLFQFMWSDGGSFDFLSSNPDGNWGFSRGTYSSELIILQKALYKFLSLGPIHKKRYSSKV